jgi:hypothetical protein
MTTAERDVTVVAGFGEPQTLMEGERPVGATPGPMNQHEHRHASDTRCTRPSGWCQSACGWLAVEGGVAAPVVVVVEEVWQCG